MHILALCSLITTYNLLFVFYLFHTMERMLGKKTTLWMNKAFAQELLMYSGSSVILQERPEGGGGGGQQAQPGERLLEVDNDQQKSSHQSWSKRSCEGAPYTPVSVHLALKAYWKGENLVDDLMSLPEPMAKNTKSHVELLSCFYTTTISHLLIRLSVQPINRLYVIENNDQLGDQTYHIKVMVTVWWSAVGLSPGGNHDICEIRSANLWDAP